MDSKAAMRSRMREAVQKRGKRIDSPLVRLQRALAPPELTFLLTTSHNSCGDFHRYNDVGQPCCKVCNVAVKSESLWTAHLASRQHKVAVDDLKAKAAAISAPKGSELPRASAANASSLARPSSTLPDDFFDATETKRPKTVSQVDPAKSAPNKKVENSKSHHVQASKNGNQSVQPSSVVPPPSVRLTSDDSLTSETSGGGKSALPEGFFDSVDADHRARGLEPPKLDIQDEWKEFQKSIKDNIEEVDYRQEEEEFEAAEEREEREQLEQRTLFQRIELIKQRQQEKVAAAERARVLQAKIDESGDESSDDTDEEDEEDNLFVDWRAKHL